MATLGLNPVSVFPTTTATTTGSPPSPFLLCGRYEFLEGISRGAYGAVFKARDTKTGRIVAVKLEFDGKSVETQREINILAALPRHPSIVEYCDCPVDQWKGVLRAFIVMEYLETDLHRFMESRGRAHAPLSLGEVKRLMQQLLEGVEQLHESGVMHRDLKPSNILVDQSNKLQPQLKIGDFGLSRFFDLRRPTVRDSRPVCTLWYRAPELLLGAHEYSCAIDIWSVGCIMAELLLNKVLFQGRDELSQLASIYNVLGMQGFSSLPGSGEFLGVYKVERPYNLLAAKFIHLSATFPGPPVVTALCLDLITKLLKYDPDKRITATEALRHAWFDE